MTMTSDLPLTNVHLFVIHSQLHGHEVCLNVLGGYACGDTVMILYRDVADGMMPAKDSIGKYIAARGGIEFGNRNDQEYILDDNWVTFGLLEDGQMFRMGGSTWSKLPLDHIRRMLHNKTLVVL